MLQNTPTVLFILVFAPLSCDFHLSEEFAGTHVSQGE